MKVKPLKDFVLIKPEEAVSKTPSGIIIPDNAKEKTVQGFVCEIGSKDFVSVSVGQKVMYSKYTGIPIKVDDEDYLIVKMADIIAVIE